MNENFAMRFSVERPKYCLLLDRDGVVNVDSGYVGNWDEFEFISGSIEAMRQFSASDYSVIIITNQSGIARGYFELEDYKTITENMVTALRDAGVDLIAVYCCPHHPEGVVSDFVTKCNCRKPAPGMINRALSDYGLDAQRCVFVGDKATDLLAAQAAGIECRYLVDGGAGAMDMQNGLASALFESLLECARFHLTLD